MPDKSYKRKLGSDPSSIHSDVEVASLSNDENLQISERDFEDILNKIQNKISKRLRGAEFGHRENSDWSRIFPPIYTICLVLRLNKDIPLLAEVNKNAQEEVAKTRFPSNLSSNSMFQLSFPACKKISSILLQCLVVHNR